jgi:hypothetical protein
LSRNVYQASPFRMPSTVRARAFIIICFLDRPSLRCVYNGHFVRNRLAHQDLHRHGLSRAPAKWTGGPCGHLRAIPWAGPAVASPMRFFSLEQRTSGGYGFEIGKRNPNEAHSLDFLVPIENSLRNVSRPSGGSHHNVHLSCRIRGRSTERDALLRCLRFSNGRGDYVRLHTLGQFRSGAAAQDPVGWFRGTQSALSSYFFSSAIQFRTTLNGACAVSPAGTGNRNFFPSAVTSQPAVFSLRLGSVDARSLGLPSADVLSISSSGEMAIANGRHYTKGWTSSL